ELRGERAPGAGLAGPRRAVDRDDESVGSHAPGPGPTASRAARKASFSAGVPTETRRKLGMRLGSSGRTITPRASSFWNSSRPDPRVSNVTKFARLGSTR